MTNHGTTTTGMGDATAAEQARTLVEHPRFAATATISQVRQQSSFKVHQGDTKDTKEVFFGEAALYFDSADECAQRAVPMAARLMHQFLAAFPTTIADAGAVHVPDGPALSATATATAAAAADGAAASDTLSDQGLVA